MRRLLLVKTSSLGDVVHNLPVVSDIRARFPACEIDWVVEEAFADIPALHPAVTRVLPVAMRRWRRGLFTAGMWRELVLTRAGIRQESYDAIIDTQGLIKSAWIARWARGPLHGQDRASAREPIAAWFYDHRHFVARGRHAVTRNRDLVAQSLGYPLPDASPDYGIRAPAEALSVVLPTRFIVALHATSRDSKLWPQGRWVELGRLLCEKGITLVLPWGSDAEELRAQAIAREVAGAQVLPRLGLRALAVVLARALAVIGVDTGLVHFACALNLPTVALYTDTAPLLTGVLAADAARAVNLGGPGDVPPVTAVLLALDRMQVA